MLNEILRDTKIMFGLLTVKSLFFTHFFLPSDILCQSIPMLIVDYNESLCN